MRAGSIRGWIGVLIVGRSCKYGKLESVNFGLLMFLRGVICMGVVGVLGAVVALFSAAFVDEFPLTTAGIIMGLGALLVALVDRVRDAVVE